MLLSQCSHITQNISCRCIFFHSTSFLVSVCSILIKIISRPKMSYSYLFFIQPVFWSLYVLSLSKSYHAQKCYILIFFSFNQFSSLFSFFVFIFYHLKISCSCLFFRLAIFWSHFSYLKSFLVSACSFFLQFPIVSAWILLF